MARLLVTGASGLLGSNLVLQAREEHEVVAASYRTAIRLPGVTAYAVDLREPRGVRDLVDAAQPDWIVHCAAATDLDACQADPAWAFGLNRDAAGLLAGAGRRARFVHISTDCVFDGETGGYDEQSPPAPVSIYGESKWRGEQAVLEAHPEALIVRTNIYGWNAQAKTSLAEWFLLRAEGGTRSPGWQDIFSTPILVNDLAEIVLALLGKGERGIYHVGGGTCLSKFEFGRRVLTTFGLDPAGVDPTDFANSGLSAPRARNLCMNSSKVEGALGLRLPTVDQGLARFRRLREEGWVGQLQAMVAARTPAPESSKEARHR